MFLEGNVMFPEPMWDGKTEYTYMIRKMCWKYFDISAILIQIKTKKAGEIPHARGRDEHGCQL